MQIVGCRLDPLRVLLAHLCHAQHRRLFLASERASDGSHIGDESSHARKRGGFTGARSGRSGLRRQRATLCDRGYKTAGHAEAARRAVIPLTF
jgi:hypothetical protein